MRGVARSVVDPFVVPEDYSAGPFGSWKSAKGKTFSTPRLTGGETTGVFVIVGQSTCSNSCEGGPYTPTNGSKLDNFNVFDGGTYVAADPLLGCTTKSSVEYSNLFFRAADLLITQATYDRIILAPIGFGGTAIAKWATGGILQNRPLIAAQRLAAVGLSVSAFIWMHGETDNTLNTAEATYQTALEQVIATVRNGGYDAPWIIGTCSFNGTNADANITNAQAAVVDDVDIFSGADTDSLTGANRQSDTVHFSDAGADAAADLWKTAIAAALS